MISITDAMKILGVEPGADPSVLRAAYRRKIRALHPDVSGDHSPAGQAAARDVLDAYLVLVVTLGMTLVACGGDDASPVASTVLSDSEDGGDSTESGDVDTSVADDASTGGGRTIVIDPASMPSPGDGQFEVEGTTHDFAAADAAGGPASSCSVDPAAIVVELQLSPGALLLQANSADGENWQGMVTISPPGSDRIYFSSPGFEGTFAVQDTMTIYEGDFFWRTSDDPAAREEAGIGTVRVTC